MDELLKDASRGRFDVVMACQKVGWAYAYNCCAELLVASDADWLLNVDNDIVPPPNILDKFRKLPEDAFIVSGFVSARDTRDYFLKGDRKRETPGLAR